MNMLDNKLKFMLSYFGNFKFNNFNSFSFIRLLGEGGLKYDRVENIIKSFTMVMLESRYLT